MKNTPTMDAFEWDNPKPKISDNMTVDDLPKTKFKGLPKMQNRRKADLGTKVQNWMKRQEQSGLNTGGDPMAEKYISEHKAPASQRGIDEVHQALGVTPHPPVEAPAPKVAPLKATNPAIKAPKAASWGEWEPPKQASFFTRKVAGWKWDDYLSGYISKEARDFACSCGQKVASPSYKTCSCGKIWNVYAIGDTHHLASDSAGMYIAREIPQRPGVIMANRKLANAGVPDIHDHIYEVGDDGLPTWLDDPYERSHAKALRDLGEHHSFAQYLSDRAYNKFMDAHDGSDENLAENWWARSGMADNYLKAVQQHLDGGRTATKTAKSDCNCWDGYERVPGTKPCAEGSCRKCDSHRKESRKTAGCDSCHGMARQLAMEDLHDRMVGEGMNSRDALNKLNDRHDDTLAKETAYYLENYQDALGHENHTAALKANRSHADLVAMIDKLADWTKYDGDDPANALGKSKPASTKVSQPPKDWAKRLPAGDPSKKGGTWTRPTIGPKSSPKQ